MITLASVRPWWAAVKPGPPGMATAAASGSEKSIWRPGRGAGAVGAATDVSPEKSMLRPPKDRFSGLAGAGASVAGATGTAGESSCCLLIDASLPRRPYPQGVSQGTQVRKHVAPEQLELLGPLGVADREQDVLGAGVGKLAVV